MLKLEHIIKDITIITFERFINFLNDVLNLKINPQMSRLSRHPSLKEMYF